MSTFGYLADQYAAVKPIAGTDVGPDGAITDDN